MNINIDFGLLGTGPASEYAGAGSPGFWNVIDQVSPSGVGQIRDTVGQLTPLTLTTTQTMVDVTPSAQPFSATDAPLLGDYLVGGANTFTLTLSGLPEGVYSVVVYTTGRQDFPKPSTVTPFADPLLAETNSGVYGGALQEGITHSVHEVSVPSTGLPLRISSSSDGFINGLQIIAVPEPGAAVLIGAACLLALLRRRG